MLDAPTRKPPLELLRPAVRAMQGYTPGEQVNDLVKLNTNEGAFPPSPRVMATLAAIADDSLRLYPDPVAGRLREAAARRYGVPVESVLAGNGSDDCLTILYRGFLDPGERIVCPWPTYGLYDTLASLQGATLVRLPFRQSGRRLELPADLARQRAKLIILANPNNPTATLVPVDAALKIQAKLSPTTRWRACVRRSPTRRWSSSTRPTSTSRSARASTPACSPTSGRTRTWSCCERSQKG